MSNKLIDIVNISKAFDENVVLDELNLYISSGTKRLRKNNTASYSWWIRDS